jgi:HlyD family secretion protein
MTATVRAISARHDDVLRVPNSALRFRPPPDLVEQPADKRDARGASGAAVAAEGKPGDATKQRPADRQGGGGSGRGGGGGGRVYVPSGGKVSVVRFRAGISDDEYTEVLSGPLHEGDEVVIDVVGGSQKAPAGPTQGQNRGRGPRLF